MPAATAQPKPATPAVYLPATADGRPAEPAPWLMSEADVLRVLRGQFHRPALPQGVQPAVVTPTRAMALDGQIAAKLAASAPNASAAGGSLV